MLCLTAVYMEIDWDAEPDLVEADSAGKLPAGLFSIRMYLNGCSRYQCVVTKEALYPSSMVFPTHTFCVLIDEHAGMVFPARNSFI